METLMKWVLSSNWFHSLVEDQGRSQRCWVRVGSGAATHSPAAEKQEQTDDGSPNHGSWCGESPMVEGFLLGLLGHRLQLINQELGIKLAGDSFPESVNRFGDLFVFRLLEKLAQSPGPVEPFGVELNLLAVVGRDDVIHGPDVAAGIDLDGLT